jgi:hypothetical protein
MKTPLKTFVSTLIAGSLLLAAESRWKSPIDLPPQPGLPDPLMRSDGSHVRSKSVWEHQRRPELKELFAHYMYGAIPEKPPGIHFVTKLSDSSFLGGGATLKLVEISFRDPEAPHLDLMVIVPNRLRTPAPVFLAMNFCGNDALIQDARVPLPKAWLNKSCAGCTDGHATEQSRGTQTRDWPVSEMIRRGYALATFCSADADADRGDVSEGIHAWIAKHSNPPVPATAANRGTIAAWAWGFERCVDYLVTDGTIDPKRIAVVGHSRNGKTALLAAAFDERIALCVAHQAGCGGTAPSRGTVGESVQRINQVFPHWFNAEFKQFSTDPNRLPFDQHELIALVAPRPVLLGNAEADQWANPAGQFEMLKAADPVYRMLGVEGLVDARLPENGISLKGNLGYFIRPGNHSMTAGDWELFLDFADLHLRKSR